MKYKGRTDEQIHSWSGPGKRTCNHPSCSQSHGKDGWKRTWLKMFLRAAVPCPGGAWLVADWHPGILTFLTTPRRWSAGAGMLHADCCIHYTATPGPHSASYSSGAGDLSSWPVPVRRCHTWHEYRLHCITAYKQKLYTFSPSRMIIIQIRQRINIIWVVIINMNTAACLLLLAVCSSAHCSAVVARSWSLVINDGTIRTYVIPTRQLHKRWNDQWTWARRTLDIYSGD